MPLLDELRDPSTRHRDISLGDLCREAADAIERLRRIEIAALFYFVSYCRDEAEELECCVSPEQHKAAQELRDALANGGAEDR